VVKVIGRKDCIAAADGRFNRIRQVAPMCPPIKCSKCCPSARMHALSAQSFFANVNSRSRSLYVIARPSVVCLSFVVCRPSAVCNVRAPYSGSSNFRQYFYGIKYLGHPLTAIENFTEIVPGEPSAGGVKHKRGSQI